MINFIGFIFLFFILLYAYIKMNKDDKYNRIKNENDFLKSKIEEEKNEKNKIKMDKLYRIKEKQEQRKNRLKLIEMDRIENERTEKKLKFQKLREKYREIHS
jgi:hypothetical protein